MTYLDTRPPEFTIGIRGYDRAQVDEYVQSLLEEVADAEERAGEPQVFNEHAAIGPRVTEIFALAEAEARELRERVSTEAAEVVAEARTEAEAIIEAAERGARETRERSQREHSEMLAEFALERDRLREEAAVLERRKAEAIGELNRLREMLGEAAGLTSSAPEMMRIDPGEPTRVLPRGDDETVELPAVTPEPDEL